MKNFEEQVNHRVEQAIGALDAKVIDPLAFFRTATFISMQKLSY